MGSILDQLASASGQAKQDQNIALAKHIAEGNNKSGTEELIAGLTNKTKVIRHDCIKTLYEIAALNPGLVSRYTATFVALFDDKDNRMQWGAMAALSAICIQAPDIVFKALDKIIDTADKGSVITKDHAVRILVALSKLNDAYGETTLPLLLDQLQQAPVNQAPSYAEQILPVISDSYKPQFAKILLRRIGDTEQESKRKRLEKVLKKSK